MRLPPLQWLTSRRSFGAHGLVVGRPFASTARSCEQHLLWSGTVLDQTCSSHQEFSQDLFLAAGAGDDLAEGDITLLQPSASPTRGHTMLPYRTAASSPLSRIFTVGRNTFSQLGVGFASQEATFGLVRPGFSGSGGVERVVAGQGQSWILTSASRQNDSPRLFAYGNNTLGQLGLPASQRAASTPTLDLLTTPREVSLGDDARVESIAAGLDHAVIVQSSIGKDGARTSRVCTTGLNADGQLGRPLQGSSPSSNSLPQLFDASFQPVLEHTRANHERPLQYNVAAGGDTSFAWTTPTSDTLEPLRAWAWGNNEYGQCLESIADAGDQITEPREVSELLRSVIGNDRQVAQVQLGGSWIAILDDTGRLFTAGFGATGRSPSKDGEPLHLGQVEGIPPLSLIAASNDAIMVVSKCRKRVFTWGLDSNGGVLGIGTWSESSEPHHDVIRRVTHPVEIDVRRHLPLIAQIESVALGGDHSWILVEDGIEPRGVWRGGSAAVVSL